ncbi:hypothetical protein [Vallitalea guaymasensis]|uniref:hypothetical protein n=1 Tax=Vallitalea guaymasensis TaxID=1185412 RepID=UPI000DE518C8|nr:hypothetical protein [Vallitalea guaymasensis]
MTLISDGWKFLKRTLNDIKGIDNGSKKDLHMDIMALFSTLEAIKEDDSINTQEAKALYQAVYNNKKTLVKASYDNSQENEKYWWWHLENVIQNNIKLEQLMNL